MKILCVFVEIRTFLKDGVELYLRFNDHRILRKEEMLPVCGRSSRNVQCPATDQADPPAVWLGALLSAVRLKETTVHSVGRITKSA